MRKIDYNKILYLIGIALIAIFCMFVLNYYLNCDYINNFASLYFNILAPILIFLVLGLLCIYLYNQNTYLKVVNYDIKSNKLPLEFNGYKIVQISDFHNTNSKRIKKKILSSLKDIAPDIIVVTGDLIDSRRTNIITALEFFKEIVKIAPVYYVLGNHESRLKNIELIEYPAKKIGLNVLRNVNVELKKAGNSIELIGLDDPCFYAINGVTTSENVGNKLNKLVKTNEKYKILLVHRPELIDVYSKYKIDLVFAGHAHGGQIRVPFVGGLVAPNQGFFPKYTKGIYEKKNTTLIVSPGIGNSGCPFRINNRPHLMCIRLKTK